MDPSSLKLTKSLTWKGLNAATTSGLTSAGILSAAFTYQALPGPAAGIVAAVVGLYPVITASFGVLNHDSLSIGDKQLTSMFKPASQAQFKDSTDNMLKASVALPIAIGTLSYAFKRPDIMAYGAGALLATQAFITGHAVHTIKKLQKDLV